jgi:Sulfatase
MSWRVPRHIIVFHSDVTVFPPQPLRLGGLCGWMIHRLAEGARMTRRKLVKAAAATIGAMVVPCGIFAQEKEKERHNVLFVIADDWSWGQAGVYGDRSVRTPNFDRVAREGALFGNSYCISPSCSPSRAGILTGRPPHALEEGANLWGQLPAKFAV